MNRTMAIAVKEFRQIWRDPLSLGMLVFVPALLLILYGYALSFDVKHIRVGVCDQDCTPESRAFMDSMFQNPYFDRVAVLASPAEAETMLVRERARAVVILPVGYAGALLRGETAQVQILVDGANANAGLTTVGYIESLVDQLTREIRMRALERRGMSRNLPLVMPEPRIWFNPELKSAHFLVPGLSGLLLMLSTVIVMSLSIVREKERQTMEQMMVSPVRPLEIIAGKTLPYIIICFVTMGMILLLGRYLFGVEVRGSLLLLALVTCVFLFSSLGIGVLISASTESQALAFQIAILVSLLPSLLLSGFIFPITSMPLVLQWITTIIVPRHFVSALREIILKGAGLEDIMSELVAMMLLGLMFNVMAIHKTRKSI